MDGQWLMATKDYAYTRFSALDQINAQNVNQLKLAWTFSTGGTRGEEAAPLVVGDTMYVVTPFPNYLYALDLTMPRAPMKRLGFRAVEERRVAWASVIAIEDGKITIDDPHRCEDLASGYDDGL